MSTIDWERVQKSLARDDHRMIWKPYGLPTVLDLEKGAFTDAPVQPAWTLPAKVAVEVAITGAFFQKQQNPSQPITPDEIYQEARACAAAGASAIHLHMRDEQGYNALSLDLLAEVINPLREEFPQLAIDGCLVCALSGEWAEMERVLDSGILDATPVNTTATYIGDSLFAKPVPIMLEKARLIQEAGAKTQVAVYTDGDVSNAQRYLFDTGLVAPGAPWLVLPSLPGCSPMNDPFQMMEGLMHMVAAIRRVDEEAVILVCAAGRASSYLATAAAILGLHIRVGMEDTVWRWPHREDKIESNLQAFEDAKQLVTGLGREIMTHQEYRQLLSMKPESSTVPVG